MAACIFFFKYLHECPKSTLPQKTEYNFTQTSSDGIHYLPASKTVSWALMPKTVRKAKDRAYSSIGFIFLLGDDYSAHRAWGELRLLNGKYHHPDSAHFDAPQKKLVLPPSPARDVARKTFLHGPRKCLLLPELSSKPWNPDTKNDSFMNASSHCYPPALYRAHFMGMPVLATSPRHGDSFIQQILPENQSRSALAECQLLLLMHVEVSAHFFLPQVHSRLLIPFQ